MSTSLPVACLIFAGGGTGGHFYPAVAIANAVADRLKDTHRIDIHFVGTRRGIEYRNRKTLGYPLHIVNVRGLVRSFTLKNLLVPFVLVGAFVRAWLLLGKISPQVVVGTGGYVALPMLRMAALRGIPTVLQEQNSFPGVTTRKLAPHAKRIYLGFKGAREYLRTDATVMVSGNPVRTSVLSGSREDACRHFALDPHKKTILIIGGSQGARAINNAVLDSIERTPLDPNVQLLWQTGSLDHATIVSRLGADGERHAIFAFEERMDLVLAAADIAIARAGALTLAELEACSVPALLVPYPHAAGDHQRKNAEEYASAGGATVINQTDLASIDIVTKAVTMLQDGEADSMATALKTQKKTTTALVTITDGIVEIIHRRTTAGGGSDGRGSASTESKTFCV